MENIGDVKDKNIIIIDDLVDTAGTLCAAATLLIGEGARSVRAYCTHGILSGNALERIQSSALEKLFISDTALEDIQHPKIEVVSCASLFGRAIENLVTNQSLGAIDPP